jgi:3-oxoacyl-(acyl-carrier-protein) reductase
MSVIEPHEQIALHGELFARNLLKDKAALVTGASRGIGRAIALALAEAGARVAINYQRSAMAAEDVCTLARVMGVQAHTYRADVSLEDETGPMIDEVIHEFGQVDILVNNAGITRDKTFAKMTREMWDEVVNVNLNGPFNITRALLPGMIERGWGRIINVSSIVGQTGNFGQCNYAVTKGGLIALTKSLAREVARKGVTVNAIAPGFIDTDMVRNIPPDAMENVKAAIPLGRLGRPEEVAVVAVFLASPLASYITGQVIPVNGGMYM